MRLDKFLADMNMDSRSNLKKAIRKGNVTVNGSQVKDPGAGVERTDRITYFGQEVRYETEQYIMLNKPKGVLTATMDKKQETVMDLLDPDRRKDLFPVGRLDRDTTGLLLITNHGELAHRLLRPKSHVDKTYQALIRGCVDEKIVEAFAGGLQVDAELSAMPAKLVIHPLPTLQEAEERFPDLEEETRALLEQAWMEENLSASNQKDATSSEGKGLQNCPSKVISYISITIHEGKFHQIKRMFEAVDMEVLELKRITMGGLTLDDGLAPGESRALTEEEVSIILSDGKLL